MAKFKIEDLEDIESDDIRLFFKTNDVLRLPKKVQIQFDIKPLMTMNESHLHRLKISRVEKLLEVIILERFKNNQL